VILEISAFSLNKRLPGIPTSFVLSKRCTISAESEVKATTLEAPTGLTSAVGDCAGVVGVVDWEGIAGLQAMVNMAIREIITQFLSDRIN
jgi:hypothetical protein